jgi:hypothetical protein
MPGQEPDQPVPGDLELQHPARYRRDSLRQRRVNQARATNVVAFFGSGLWVSSRGTNTPNEVRAVVFHEDKFWAPTTLVSVRVTDGMTMDVLPHILTTTRFPKNVPASRVPAGFGEGSSCDQSAPRSPPAGGLMIVPSQVREKVPVTISCTVLLLYGMGRYRASARHPPMPEPHTTPWP